jgi:large subunit ribosomal protein L14e
MPAIEIGRICVKTSGREMGKKCVIVDVVDESFVVITGPKSLTGVRRRRSNLSHIQATEEMLELKKGATDEEVVKVAEKGKKTAFLKAPKS